VAHGSALLEGLLDLGKRSPSYYLPHHVTYFSLEELVTILGTQGSKGTLPEKSNASASCTLKASTSGSYL